VPSTTARALIDRGRLALSALLPVVPEALAGRMRMEQLLIILRLTPVMMGANIFIAALVLLAGFSGPHRVSLSIWACLVVSYGLLGLRGWLASRRRKSGKATVSPRGLRSIILQAGLLGCLWGALPVLAMDGASVQMRMLIVSVIAGMIGCGGFAMLTLPPAAIAYSTPMVMGSLVVLLTSRDPILMALAGLLIFCYLVVTFSSLSHARVFAERLIAGEELEHQRQMVSLLLSDFEEGASDWLWEVDASGALTYVSDRMAEAAGLAREALLGRNVASFAVQVAEAEPGLAADLTGILGERKAFRDVTLRMTVEGTDRWWSLTAKPTHDLSGTFTGFRGVGADVTEARQAQDHIRRLAHFDVLTQLPNRLSFLEALNRAWVRQETGDAGGCAVLCVDLDYFKSVNDSLGHPVGDALLIEVADRLARCVGETGFAARLGGDEFAVIVAPATGADTLAALARDIVDQLSQPYDIKGHSVLIGASVGIAVAPEDAGNPDDLLKNADLALYRAKSDGRGAFCFFEMAMDQGAQERRALEMDLRAALKNDELTVFFQPLIGRRDHEITGFEALVRWQHPQRGLVMPGDFIECAEQWGLIGKIGEWVLNQACAQAVSWPAPLTVAVNLSPNQFMTGELVGQATRALQASGLEPWRLELEITEGLLLNDTTRTMEQLTALKALGVKIAMDDFGTGYSSLGYLWRFPFDKIKLDRSFVAEMKDNSAITDIVRTITLLGQALKLQVTAEGVETTDQMRILTEMHCDHFQGYLFGRPMPVSDIPGFLVNDLARRMRRQDAETDSGSASISA